MIEVNLTSRDGQLELGKIRIENVGGDDEYGDYSIQFAVERCGAVGLHRRSIHRFPRTKYNVLALLKQALETLDPKELELEDETTASDMAGRQRGTLPALPGKEDDRLHHHRSPFWRR